MTYYTYVQQWTGMPSYPGTPREPMLVKHTNHDDSTVLPEGAFTDITKAAYYKPEPKFQPSELGVLLEERIGRYINPETMPESFRDGSWRNDAVDITPEAYKQYLTQPQPIADDTVTADGKKIVENDPIGLITFHMDKMQQKLSYAASSIEMGEPTHGFFFHKMDFLYDAAQEYTMLKEDEVFRYRNIDDSWFINDTLDFFTDGHYSNADVEIMQEQITSLVRELAQQLKDGKKADVEKTKTKLTVAGQDVSITKLMQYQEAGRKIEKSFREISLGNLYVTQYAEMGIAHAMGTSFAHTDGEIGKLFAARIDTLYERAKTCIDRDFARPHMWKWRDSDKDAVETGKQIADLFSALRNTSKASMRSDFSAKLDAARTLAQEHCSRFGISLINIGFASDTVKLMQYFDDWLAIV